MPASYLPERISARAAPKLACCCAVDAVGCTAAGGAGCAATGGAAGCGCTVAAARSARGPARNVAPGSPPAGCVRSVQRRYYSVVAQAGAITAHALGEVNCRADGGNCVSDPLTPFDLAQGQPFALAPQIWPCFAPFTHTGSRLNLRNTHFRWSDGCWTDLPSCSFAARSLSAPQSPSPSMDGCRT
jgi:hypothetical protein